MSGPILPRVLLVEDSPINVAYVGELLAECHCLVEVAEDGRRALQLFQPGVHTLVLMDCQMPHLDGYEATRHIRERERAAATPPARIVGLTANATGGVAGRCLACGMDAVLIKPFRPEEFWRLAELAGAPETPASRRNPPGDSA